MSMPASRRRGLPWLESDPDGSVRLTGTDLLAYAMTKPGAWRDEPWEGDLVAKVANRIFLFGGGSPRAVGVKCGNRDEADELIARHPDDVSVMAYIGRHGWNTVRVGAGISDDELLELVDASYDDVVARLPRSKRP